MFASKPPKCFPHDKWTIWDIHVFDIIKTLHGFYMWDTWVTSSKSHRMIITCLYAFEIEPSQIQTLMTHNNDIILGIALQWYTHLDNITCMIICFVQDIYSTKKDDQGYMDFPNIRNITTKLYIYTQSMRLIVVGTIFILSLANKFKLSSEKERSILYSSFSFTWLVC